MQCSAELITLIAMAYSKLHSSLVNSSLWTEPDNVRILFITLLALCDRQGYVYGSKPGLERLANILVEEDDGDPWYTLMAPDVNSSDRMRNPENEGRRIEEVSGGFRLLNFEYYRGLRNDDDRREQNREAQARFKAKAKVSQDKPASSKKSRRKQTPSVSASVSESVSEDKKKPISELDVVQYCEDQGLTEGDGQYFWNHWQSNGNTNGGKPILDWKGTIRSWKAAGHCPSQKLSGASASAIKPRTLSFAEREKRIGALRDRRNSMFKSLTDSYTGEQRKFTEKETAVYDDLTKQLSELEG